MGISVPDFVVVDQEAKVLKSGLQDAHAGSGNGCRKNVVMTDALAGQRSRLSRLSRLFVNKSLFCLRAGNILFSRSLRALFISQIARSTQLLSSSTASAARRKPSGCLPRPIRPHTTPTA